MCRTSNIESDNSQTGGLEDYNYISDWIFPPPCKRKKTTFKKSKKSNYYYSLHGLTYHLVLRAIWPHYVKWNFSTFCGLSRSTTYLYLPQGRIGPLDPRSYPQGGVQIYPMANLLHKMWKQKYPPPNSDFWKNLTLAWFWPIIWHISNPEPSDTF